MKLKKSLFSSFGSSPAIDVNIGFRGEPQSGHTYTPHDLGATGGADVLLGTSAAVTAYVASAGTSGAGSYTLRLTSVTPSVGPSGETSYTVSGTLDATLAAKSPGATGSIVLHASF